MRRGDGEDGMIVSRLLVQHETASLHLSIIHPIIISDRLLFCANVKYIVFITSLHPFHV